NTALRCGVGARAQWVGDVRPACGSVTFTGGSRPRPCTRLRGVFMAQLNGFGNVVLPARDLPASIAAWTALLGRPPAFQSDDFAAFSGDGVELGLTAAPWMDHPLVFWTVEDIEQAHRTLVAAGATPMTEVADGSLAEVGTA